MATLGAEIGCLTLMVVLAAVFGGIWLDRLLGTKPWLTISLVLGSAPLALVLTFWVATRTARKITPPPASGGGKVSSWKEDDAGE